MTTIIHLWKKKSLSHRTKGVRKGNVYSRMMQLLLFYFLSTLYLMFDYLWVCLWLSANHHIHAKSNEYHCRLHLAWFFCSIWPIDLGFTVPTLSSPGFPSSSVTGQSQPPVNPCYSACSLCRPWQKGHTTKTNTDSPWSGRIPYTTEQLSLWATTIEPVL